VTDRGRGGALFGALLFVAALVPRLYVALACAGEPVWDGHYYDFGAQRIARGLGYSDDRTVGALLVWHPWCHYPVGYSAFLAAFYRVFGPGHAIAGVANALVGATLAVVTWALARHAMNETRARAAGWIVALHPGLVLYAALVMSEPLAVLLTLTAFWLAVRDARPRRGIAFGALVLGVAALVRPQALLCAPFLALVAPERDLRTLLAGAAAACAVALVPVLPWTVRNCRVMDSCALVSTNGGWNLAIGAFPRATGRFETLRSSDGCRDVTGQVQQDRCWFAYGLAQIKEHPWHWLALVPAKLGYTFDHESFAVEYLHEARPEAWPEERRVGFRDGTTFAHRLLVSAAALGCIAFPAFGRGSRRSEAATQVALLVVAASLGAFAFVCDTPTFWPLAVFSSVVPWLPLPGRPAFPPALLLGVALLGTTLVTHAVFFGEDRYHVVVIPVLAMLAAAALRPSRPRDDFVSRFWPQP
jgi:4-amino-4-deoxy-L-arabinose transferase-like glycosyltransferase